MMFSPFARLLVPVRRRPLVPWLLLATALADFTAIWWLRTGSFSGALGGLVEALLILVAFFFQVSLTGVWIAHRRRGFWLRFIAAQGVVLGLTLATEVLSKSSTNPPFFFWPCLQAGLVISTLTIVLLRKFLAWWRRFRIGGVQFRFRLMTLFKVMFYLSLFCGIFVPIFQLYDNGYISDHPEVETHIILGLTQAAITAVPYAIALALRKFLGRRSFFIGVSLLSVLVLGAAVFDSLHAAAGMLVFVSPLAQCFLWYSAVRVLRRPKRPLVLTDS